MQGMEIPTTEPAPEPMTSSEMDSFETVMKAMDAELARANPKKAKAKPTAPSPKATPKPGPSKNKGKGKISMEDVLEEEDEDEDDDIAEAMAAELKASLGEDEDGELPIDYGLIKNFLESFKSQGGLSGPVSNLAGRLEPGWKLPRDQ